MAWERPSKFVAVLVPQSKDFRQFMQEDLRLSRRQTNALSAETLRVRWIVCYGIVDPGGDFRGVLCADSVEENSLKRIEPDKLKVCADLLGAMMHAHDSSKSD
jgi:hypothetical protein